MTAEQVIERYFEEVGKAGRYEALAELAHEDMVDEANRAFGGPPGRAGLEAHVRGFRRAFPDVRMEVDRIVAGRIPQGQAMAGADEVMALWRFSGQQAAPWLGRRPGGSAGDTVSGDVVSLFILRDGRIARYRLWLCAHFPEGSVTFDSSRALAAAG